MELESRTSLLPFLLGVSIIAISATGYFILLKSPPNSTNKAQVLADSISVTNTPSITPAAKTVSLPASDYPQTTFLSATADYSILPATTSADCEKFDPKNATSPVQTQTLNGQTATYQSSGSVEGDTIIEIRQYHIYQDGKCLEKTYTLKTRNILSIDPNAHITDIDHDQVWNRLQTLTLPTPT